MAVPQNSRATWAASLDGQADPILDEPDLCPPPTQQTKGRCLVTSLPAELTRQILGYLVPTGCAYHFLRCRPTGTVRAVGDKPWQLVQQIVPSEESPHKTVASAHLALAATNRHFNRLVYDVFYGENSFAFNIGITSMEAKMGSVDFNQWESWTRIIEEEGVAGPLGPLTARAAGHVREVTLLVAGSVAHTAKHVERLGSMVADAVDTLSHGSIAHLAVHVEVADRVDKRFDTIRLDKLEVSLHDGRVKIEVRDPELQRLSRMSKMRLAVEPLLKLRGIRRIQVSGLVAEDFAEELQRVSEGK